MHNQSVKHHCSSCLKSIHYSCVRTLLTSWGKPGQSTTVPYCISKRMSRMAVLHWIPFKNGWIASVQGAGSGCASTNMLHWLPFGPRIRERRFRHFPARPLRASQEAWALKTTSRSTINSCFISWVMISTSTPQPQVVVLVWVLLENHIKHHKIAAHVTWGDESPVVGCLWSS